MAICSLSLQLGSSESSAKLKNKNLSFKSALLVAYVQPYPPPPRKLKVKQKRGNFYANLTLNVFRDATLIYEKCLLIIFFCEVARFSVKVIEINNNTVANLFSIFRVNLQISVRFQIYIFLQGYWKKFRVRRGRCSISIALTKSSRFLFAFAKSATVDEKSWIDCRRVS